MNTETDNKFTIAPSNLIGVLGCPFCGDVPRWERWPGRELVILKHRCHHVNFEGVCFPKEKQTQIDFWNRRTTSKE